MMRGTRTVLVIGVILVLVSFPIQWYGTGGTGTPLAPDDARVKAALASLGREAPNRTLVSSGSVLKAWVSKNDNGYKVNLIIELYGNPWVHRSSLDRIALRYPAALGCQAGNSSPSTCAGWASL